MFCYNILTTASPFQYDSYRSILVIGLLFLTNLLGFLVKKQVNFIENYLILKVSTPVYSLHKVVLYSPSTRNNSDLNSKMV